MKLLVNQEFNLYERNGQAFCDSLMVAESFEKEHKNVLRDIEKLDCSEGFRRLNYELSSYKSTQNKKLPMCLMTKNGFTFLAMGYTGSKAARFKESYINRFDQMEEFIKSLLTAKMEYPAFTAAIKQAHENPKPYHFSNENNMIYQIVIGMDAKKFRENHGLKKGESIRSYLTAEQIQVVEALQRIDTGLNIAMLDSDTRKKLLSEYFERMGLKSIA